MVAPKRWGAWLRLWQVVVLKGPVNVLHSPEPKLGGAGVGSEGELSSWGL